MLQLLAKNGGVFGKVWLNNQWKAEGRHQIGKIYSERLERRLILKASKSKMISLLLAHILFNLFVSGDISPLASLDFTCDSLDFTCALLLFRGVGDVAVATLWCYQHASDTMLRGGQGRYGSVGADSSMANFHDVSDASWCILCAVFEARILMHVVHSAWQRHDKLIANVWQNGILHVQIV